MSMPEFSWFVVIDSVIYLSLILVAYFVVYYYSFSMSFPSIKMGLITK